jgi:hypothetical protein
MQHHPGQYAHNQMGANGEYYDGRKDALIYSQPPGQFQYTPPSQESLHYNDDNNNYDQTHDTHMQEQAPSHPAEDAQNYTLL